MSKFNELVGLARGEGFTVTSEYLDSVESAYSEALSEVESKSAGDAEIWTEERLELEAAIAERDKEISALKARNYDMLTQVPGDNGGDDSDDNGDDEENDDDVDLDDLFQSN